MRTRLRRWFLVAMGALSLGTMGCYGYYYDRPDGWREHEEHEEHEWRERQPDANPYYYPGDRDWR